ncbi:MAG TPA: hypothetical protein VND94_00630 [Terriglobia bacterium]|nr:hypothetical protein [Terriglobia bacterium]
MTTDREREQFETAWRKNYGATLRGKEQAWNLWLDRAALAQSSATCWQCTPAVEASCKETGVCQRGVTQPVAAAGDEEYRIELRVACDHMKDAQDRLMALAERAAQPDEARDIRMIKAGAAFFGRKLRDEEAASIIAAEAEKERT